MVARAVTYPFVQAKWYSPGAIAEVRALVIHFAEGGGTVGYFQNTTRDVSSHFVLQYDGTIVQMVKDGDADHCQHVDTGSWSYPGDLTRANGVAVLGSDVMDNADHTRVNRYVHAIEIEGFRATGMNTAQEASLIAWVAERRAKFPTIRGLLGHGDVQNKACPGPLIPWDRLGGHGLTQGGDVTPLSITDELPKEVQVPVGTPYLDLDGKTVLDDGPSAFLDWRPSPFSITPGFHAIYATVNGIRRLVLVQGVPARNPADPTPFSAKDMTDAKAAQLERDRAAAIAAIEAALP